MLVTLLGYMILDFLNDAGEKISGTNVWVSWPLIESPTANGVEAAKFFIPSTVNLPTLTPGAEYEARFNNKGRLLSLTEIRPFSSKA